MKNTKQIILSLLLIGVFVVISCRNDISVLQRNISPSINSTQGESTFIHTDISFFDREEDILFINHLIVEQPLGIEHGIYCVSPDGEHISFQTANETANPKIWSVNRDGVESKKYEYIENLKYSANSQTLAFTADTGKNWVVVVNNKEYIIDNGFVGEVVLSKDGKKFAYTACDGEKWYIVIDGKNSELFDEIRSPAFSPDGKHLNYIACIGDKWFSMLDGKRGKLYDDVQDSGFSIDSELLMYTALQDDKQIIVVNGVEEKPYDEIEVVGFSPVGHRFAYQATQGEKTYMVVDGVEGAAYDYIGDGIFSTDGQRFAYGAEKDNNYYLVVDGVESFDNYRDCPSRITFSPDSKRVACTVGLGGTSSVIVDGKTVGNYFIVWNIIFSPDSKRYAFVADTRSADNTKKYVVVADGNEIGRHAYVSLFRDKLTFSPDSQSIAYIADYSMIVNDQKIIIGNVNVSDPIFNSDSNIIAFNTGNNAVYINKICKNYKWVSNVVFGSANTGHFFALEIKDYIIKIYRVDFSITLE
jgi:hypothetical protein